MQTLELELPGHKEAQFFVAQTSPVYITVYPNSPFHVAAVLSKHQLGFPSVQHSVFLLELSHTVHHKPILPNPEKLRMVPSGHGFLLWSPSHLSTKHNPLKTNAERHSSPDFCEEEFSSMGIEILLHF